jgi:hypothetical protein
MLATSKQQPCVISVEQPCAPHGLCLGERTDLRETDLSLAWRR